MMDGAAMGLGAAEPRRKRRPPKRGNDDPSPSTPADDAPPPQSPNHDEWLIDEALVETFPASDPISPSAPKTSEGGPGPS